MDFKRLHKSNENYLGIVICTFDADFAGQAQRINLACKDLIGIKGFASKALNFVFLPQKSGIFEKSCIDNKELNNVLPQKRLNFSTFEAKPVLNIVRHKLNQMEVWKNST